MALPTQSSPGNDAAIKIDDLNLPATVQYDLSPLIRGGWLGKPGASPGRWAMEMGEDPWTALGHFPDDARAAIEDRIFTNSGGDATKFLKLICSGIRHSEPIPVAIILFPRDMELAIYAMRMRKNLPDFMFTAYKASTGWIDDRSVPSLGVMVVFNINRFLDIPADGGLLEKAQATLRGALDESRWICLADSPDETWTAAHASDDLEVFKTLRQRAAATADFRWQSNPRGALLHSLITNHLQVSRTLVERRHFSFSWWPGTIMQHIQTGMVVPDGNRYLVPVIAETLIASDCDVNEAGAALAMDDFNERSCGTSAMVWEPNGHSVRMSTRQTVLMPETGMELSWFAARAILQSRDAHDLASEVLDRLHGKLVDISPPGMDTRLVPDDHALGSLERNFVPTIGAWNPFTNPLEIEGATFRLRKLGAVVEQHGTGLAATVMWHGGPAVILLEPADRSKAGSGMRVTLRLPVQAAHAKVAVWANRLNNNESRWILPFVMAGAWRALPHDDHISSLGFVAFLPSCLYVPGCLGFEASSQLKRLEWVENEFVE